MDKKELTKAVLMSAFGITVALPLVLGVVLLLLLWVEVLKGFGASLLAGGLFFGAILTYIQRLAFGWKDSQEEILAKWKENREKDRKSELDSLSSKLWDDGDDRTQTLLSDLRNLTATLKETYEKNKGLGTSTAVGVMGDVDKLFETAVSYLRESLDLQASLSKIDNKKVRKKIKDKRESLIKDVKESLEYLGEVLVQLQDVSFDSSSDKKLDGIRNGIADRLSIAASVNERMTGPVISAEEEAELLKYADDAE